MSELQSIPAPERRPHAITVHGHTRSDDYYWLRKKEDADVIAYLEAENAFTKAKTAHLEQLRETLYKEMVGRIKETDDTVPVRDRPYYYYSRTEEGKQYAIHCRKHRSLDAEEEVLLDLNQIAEEGKHKYLMMGVYAVSPDHELLAYGLDITGSETYTVRFKNLADGNLLDDILVEVAGSAEWGDNRTLYYTTEQEATKRSDKAHRHHLHTEQSEDELIWHETDELFNVVLYKTKDRRYVVVGSMGIETYEMQLLDAADPAAELHLVAPRERGHRYTVEHRDGLLYIVTNSDGAVNSKLVTTPVEATGRENWTTIVPHREETKLYAIELFRDYLVRYERTDGLEQLHVTDLNSGSGHYVSFPESVYTVSFVNNVEYDSRLLRFGYTSLVTPLSIFDYDMETRERELKKQQPVLGGYDATQYHTERIFATADDGKRIPITLVYRKDAWDGETPTYLHLYGYGSYGITVDPRFSSNRISLLDRGMIYAIAHVRGSQIMGREWYEQGKFLHKKNTFTDFVAAAEHLIVANYTEPDKMSMEGRSAGGLLMGAVLNMAPELFQVAVAGVPFVDVVTTMLDETIPLTVGEFEEWGNPKDRTFYDYMLSYSPYDNVTAQQYPHVLVTAGLNDPRVQYWEPAKWVAKLRRLKTDDNDVLLKMHMGAGHFASSGRYDYLRDIAFDYAFVLDKLGIVESQPA